MAKETYDLKDIEMQLEKTPDDAELWYKKGMALVAEKRYDESIIAFSTGLIYNPFHKALRLQRGRKYITTDDYRTASAELMLATRLDPENWEAWYYLGVSLYMEGEYAECMKIQKRTIAVCREYGIGEIPAPACWYWQAAMKLGRVEDAEWILSQIDEETPCDNMDYRERLLLHKGLRDPKDFLDKKRLEDLDRPELYYMTLCFGMFNYLHYHGEEEKAIDILKEIYAMDQYHEAFVYKQTRQELRARGLLKES